MPVLLILIVAIVLLLLFKRSKNSKKPDIPPEQRQPAASDGIAVRGADGKEYIVPRSAQDAYSLYQAASMGQRVRLPLRAPLREQILRGVSVGAERLPGQRDRTQQGRGSLL